MSTTSTNFSLVLATTSDQVNVVTHIANNFSSLDSILSQVHTGTGQLKAGLNVSNWTATNPTIVGTMTGGTIVATTGRFQTITATGGALTASTLAVGTYSFPTTVGATGALLTVVTGNAVWVAPSGGTGANTGLSNLASVAINTSINTFTGGFATLDRVLATSGALTGLTVFQASTGTFAGNVTITGTLTANAINATGGAITAGSLAIGTYALPTTIGATNQILTVTTGNAVWLNRTTNTNAYIFAFADTVAALPGLNPSTGEVQLFFNNEINDTASVFNAATTAYQLTVAASGFYQIGCFLTFAVGTLPKNFIAYVIKSSGNVHWKVADYSFSSGSGPAASGGFGGSVMVLAASGDRFGIAVDPITGTANFLVSASGTSTYRTYFTAYKVPEA